MEIHEIKSRLTITQVLDHYNLKANKNGMLRCPFHDDKTPSMRVYHETNTVFCFSSNCKLHGKAIDQLDFMLHKENLTKHESFLKAQSLITHNYMEATHNNPTENQPDQPLEKLFKVFQANLKKSDKAQAYLKNRNLNPTAFEVGFNATTWPQLKHCVIFPLKDKEEKIVSFYGRSIYNNNDQRHYYTAERKGLFPRWPRSSTQTLILTEAVIDAASIYQLQDITSHLTTVLACYGTNSFTKDHEEAIKELKHLQEVVLFFDGDEAGRKAVQDVAAKLHKINPETKLTYVETPDGEDVNSLLQSHEANVIHHLIENRKPFSFSVEPLSHQENVSPGTDGQREKINLVRTDTLINTKNPNNIIYKTENANYFIKGGICKLLDSMKVTLVVEHPISKLKARGGKIELYDDKVVEKFCKEVSEKLNIRKDLLEGDIYKLTDQLDEHREKEQQQSRAAEQKEAVVLTADQRREQEAFAKQKQLIKKLNELLGQSGITGEERNRIFLLCIVISHIQPETLHALIQGSSGSGKTRLLKQISDCMPPEVVELFTRLSDKALYNYPEFYFVNRIICVEDLDGLSEEALFGLREFQSGNKLSSGVSVSLESGQIITLQKIVRGPIATLACTTHGEIYEDNMSRCFLVAVDESAEQTKRVIEYQNKKAAGLIDEKEEIKTREFIRNFVRILRPYEVVNPFADKILLPEEAHKIRRLNDLFQSFIKIVTVIHQYQRKKDSRGRLVAELEDIEVAMSIMFESIVLKVDELDGSLRQFYERLKEYLKKNFNLPAGQAGGNHAKAEFTQREVRQGLHVSKTQLFRYIENLIGLEYIQVSGGYSNRGFTYKISHWDNYQALRDRIKGDLQKQLENLKPGTPDQK